MVGMLPKKRDPAIAAMILAFIAKNGVAKLPPGFADGYTGQLKDDAQYYRGRQQIGSSRHKAIEAIRKSGYTDNLSIVGGFLSLDGKLHDRHCALPSCLKRLDDDKPPQTKYCNNTCSQKDRRRLKALDKIAANSAEKLILLVPSARCGLFAYARSPETDFRSNAYSNAARAALYASKR